MDRFVLDCSITMSWCFEDEASPETDKILESLNKNQAYVPPIWTLEITNVLINAERQKRLKEADTA